MKRHYKLLILVGIVIIIFISIKPILCLEIRDGRTGELYDIIEVEDGQAFDYASIHSVSMTPLIETIKVYEDGYFIADTVKYKDQSGAGLPEYAYDDAIFSTDGEWFVIGNMNRRYDDLSFRVNQEYDNAMIINGREIALYHYFKDGKGGLEFKIKKTNILLYNIKKMESHW